MSFEASVINVMIASPSDVPSERQIVRDVLYEWNATHAEERNQVLLPVGWETHAAPDMSGHPQSIINKQVLANCDLLVGIFWTRIGTATIDYLSGAVEEIERHIAAGKPAMLYFSGAPTNASNIVDKQFKLLQKFKDSCRLRGLYEEFSNAENFKSKFSRQLHTILKEYFRSFDSSSKNMVTTESVLSEDDGRLLKIASLDKRGIIRRVRVNSGTYIETNKVNFIENQLPREIAKWDAALQKLMHLGYVKPIGHNSDTFEMTAAGYSVADKIL